MDQALLPSGTMIGKLTVLSYVDKGNYGQVYYVHSKKDNKNYAMKIEYNKGQELTLPKECFFVQNLDNARIAQIVGTGRTKNFLFILEEALGPSLMMLMKKMKTFTIPQAVEIAKESLKCLREFHKCNLVHNDFKPANICVRPNSNAPMALIDFGLSFFNRHPVTGELLPDIGPLGTLKYAALKNHRRQKCGPADDLKSWSYVLLELFGKKLPWRHMNKNEEILNMKLETSTTDLCRKLPKQIALIFDYIWKLDSQDEIDYDKILELLEKIKGFSLFKSTSEEIWEGIFKQFQNEIYFLNEKTRQLKE